MELANDRVTLYLRRDKNKIDNYQIANELTRFVMKKYSEIYVDSVESRLVLPLKTLQRRGIPVDRLLKHVERPVVAPSIQRIQQPAQPVVPLAATTEPHADRNDTKKRSPFRWLAIFYPPAWTKIRPTVPNEIIQRQTAAQSNIHGSSVPDFRTSTNVPSTRMSEILKSSRTFTKQKLQQLPHEKHEIIESCTIDPGLNLIRYQSRFHSMAFYVDKRVVVTEYMIREANQFAQIINDLITKVFQISMKPFHLFRDIDTGKTL